MPQDKALELSGPIVSYMIKNNFGGTKSKTGPADKLKHDTMKHELLKGTFVF